MGPASRGDRAAGVAEPLIDAQILLRDATGHLRARVGDRTGARIEAEVLLAAVLGTERSRLLARDSVSAAQRDRFRDLVRIRVETGRPVAYLVGRRGFRELDLKVDERVLVPRPETEHVVEVLLDLAASGRLPAGPVVDRGTGSGAIALSLLAHLAGPVFGIDCSAEALDVAALNAASCRELAHRSLALVRADCLTCFRTASVAAVVANPPYIAEEDFASLPDDVRVHEPRVALVPDGGRPASHLAGLAAESARVLLPGGWFVTEVGEGQAESLAARLRSTDWLEVRITEDLAGIDRVVSARRG